MEANTRNIVRLARAVAGLATSATRGMARAYDLNRVGLLQLATERGPLTPSEAAAELDLPPSSITRHAQALAEAGQVVLEPNPEDARSALIRATPVGVEELRALEAAGAEVFAGVVEAWSDEEIATFAALAERLLADWATRGEAARQRRRRIVSRWQYQAADNPEPK